MYRYRNLVSWLLLAMASTSMACRKQESPRQSEGATAINTVVEKAASLDPEPQSLLFDLGKMPIPENNPQTPEKVALGHQLFFDKRLSVDGSRACYSCHTNEHGTGGQDPLAIGAGDKTLTRHSPTLWNVGYLPRLYWDGRAESLEVVTRAAWTGGNMGVPAKDLDKKANAIASVKAYKEQFAKVFPEEGVTPATIVMALSAYQRTIVCDDTAYDRYAKGDKSALSSGQRQGLSLFMGKAACTMCHAPPFFSTTFMVPTGTYFNTGMGVKDKPEADVDVGRFKVTENQADMAAFKVPGLRGISKSGPYFHNGSVEKLEDAVRFMATGGYDNKNKTALLTDRKLSEAEIQSIVAFLGALDCSKKLEEPELPK